MRRLTGIILMATIAYAGHIGINHFFTDNFDEKAAFSNLRTKLQKTLVMIDTGSTVELKQPSEAQVFKKKSSATRAAVTNPKSLLITTMNSTYKSLAEVRHIFRHEVEEMIDIIKKSEPAKKLSPKLTYAKNWSAYIKKNVAKFNMSQSNKNKINNMVTEMQSYISNLSSYKPTKVAPKVLVAAAASPSPSIAKAVVAPVKISKVSPKASNNSASDIVKKSISESLQALKNWEASRKKANTIVESSSMIWFALVAMFALIALWMSNTKKPEKLIVTEFDADNVMGDESYAMSTSLEKNQSSDYYFFDEISNSLSTLCQAKGIILDTEELEGSHQLVDKYSLSEIEQEIEDFTKTIIRSLGKEGTKNVKLTVSETSTKLKMTASVTSEDSLDINMTRIASGFRDLEDKLISRKGVFNIEQSVSGNDIDFVMQLTADEKDETKNVEQVEQTPPTA